MLRTEERLTQQSKEWEKAREELLERSADPDKVQKDGTEYHVLQAHARFADRVACRYGILQAKLLDPALQASKVAQPGSAPKPPGASSLTPEERETLVALVNQEYENLRRETQVHLQEVNKALVRIGRPYASTSPCELFDTSPFREETDDQSVRACLARAEQRLKREIDDRQDAKQKVLTLTAAPGEDEEAEYARCFSRTQALAADKVTRQYITLRENLKRTLERMQEFDDPSEEEGDETSPTTGFPPRPRTLPVPRSKNLRVDSWVYLGAEEDRGAQARGSCAQERRDSLERERDRAAAAVSDLPTPPDSAEDKTTPSPPRLGVPKISFSGGTINGYRIPGDYPESDPLNLHSRVRPCEWHGIVDPHVCCPPQEVRHTLAMRTGIDMICEPDPHEVADPRSMKRFECGNVVKRKDGTFGLTRRSGSSWDPTVRRFIAAPVVPYEAWVPPRVPSYLSRQPQPRTVNGYGMPADYPESDPLGLTGRVAPCGHHGIVEPHVCMPR